jgi:hypothetical protein
MADKLDFVLADRVEETFDHERDEVWWEKCALDDEDCGLLVEHVFKTYAPNLTVEDVQKAAAQDLFVGELEGVEEYPLELWYVVDEEEEIQFRLWLFHQNRGRLVDNDGNAVGEVHACILHANSEHLDYHQAEELREMLKAGQARAKKEHAKTELMWIDF